MVIPQHANWYYHSAALVTLLCLWCLPPEASGVWISVWACGSVGMNSGGRLMCGTWPTHWLGASRRAEIGLLTGQNWFFHVPCVQLQQLLNNCSHTQLRRWDLGFHCFTRGLQPFCFPITSIAVKQQKTFLSWHESELHESFLHESFCRQASEALAK